MGNEIVGKYVIHNDTTVDTGAFDTALTSIYPGVYEVIRIIDGVPLFFEMHMSRFRKSANILGFELGESDRYIAGVIEKLAGINQMPYGNVKIIINHLDKLEHNIILYYMVSKYPEEKEIQNGVPLILYHAMRNNPNAKSTDLSFREGIHSAIEKSNAYEALMVNNHDEITEGSKSNVFFAKNDILYTPPLGSVLAGVTRSCVMDICREMSLTVIEKPVSKNFLNEIDGLFITGTSPQVLPVSSVDDHIYASSSNTVITSIRKAYEKMVREYIEKNRG